MIYWTVGVALLVAMAVEVYLYVSVRDDVVRLQAKVEELEQGTKWAHDFQGTVNTRTAQTVKALCDAQGFDYYDASPNWIQVKLDTTCTTRVARKPKGMTTTTRRGA